MGAEFKEGVEMGQECLMPEFLTNAVPLSYEFLQSRAFILHSGLQPLEL